MKEFVKQNTLFLSVAVIVLAVMIAALCIVPKAELHLVLNARHTPFLDTFFHYYTLFVQWPVYVLMLLPLLFRRPVWTAMFAVAEGLSALIVQALKHLLNMPRPKTFFESLAEVQPDLFAAWQNTLVDGIHLHSWHSFPSGHTATFFVFFSLCAFLYAEKRLPCCQWFGLICFLLALLGGYSRIYLSQHFLLDVTVGMAEAILVSVFVFCLSKRLLRFPRGRRGISEAV